MFQIYIPSRGRPRFATAKILNEPRPPYIDLYVVMDIDMEEKPRPYTVFVEPQDAEAYRKAGHASIVVLPENEKGVAYARQAILDYAIQNNDKWFWVIDNDVIQFSAGSAETIRSRLTETWTEEFYANAPSEFLHYRNFSRFLLYCIDNPEQEPLFEVERTEERKRVVKFRLKLGTFDPAP